MVAGRADRDEGHAFAALLEGVQGGQARSRATPGRRPRVLPRIRVRVNSPAPLGTEGREAGEIVRVMDSLQIAHGGLVEGGRDDLVCGSERTHALHHGRQAGRLLGMAGPPSCSTCPEGPATTSAVTPDPPTDRLT